MHNSNMHYNVVIISMLISNKRHMMSSAVQQHAARPQMPQPSWWRPPVAVPAPFRIQYAHIGKPNIRIFQGKEQEDVFLWVRHFQQVARLSGWSDNDTTALAELHMLDKTQSWFVGLDKATP